jgi:hypothetical protein
MLYLRSRSRLIGLLLLIALGQHVQAAVETIPTTPIPPPPGELDFLFPNPPPPSFDRVNLRFTGSARSNSSQTTLLTWKFDWRTPTGDLEYSPPIIYALQPRSTIALGADTAVAGCPSDVGLVFITESSQGATVSGTFEHTCTIPEPSSLPLFILIPFCLLTSNYWRAKGSIGEVTWRGRD